jgi:opacity protein-like surface antigen
MWKYAIAVVMVLAVPATLAGGGWYVSGSIGSVSQGDSDNSGAFTSDFTTGDGSPAVPNGTVLPAGTSVGWTTEFDAGMAFSLEAGKRYSSGFRSGIELSFGSSDVDSHAGVSAGGTVIDGVDAAVLTGSSTQLGVTVGEVVAVGRGDVSTMTLMANAYYDFNREGKVSPYLGAGIGVSDVDVTFNPSDVGIIDDGETAFAYQLKAGATVRFGDAWEGFAEYAYRSTGDIETDADLIPVTLEVENTQGLVSVGARYRF